MDGKWVREASESARVAQGPPHRLTPLIRPRVIALVGASPRPGSVGAAMVETALKSGFPGPVHLVNPEVWTG